MIKYIVIVSKLKCARSMINTGKTRRIARFYEEDQNTIYLPWKYLQIANG